MRRASAVVAKTPSTLDKTLIDKWSPNGPQMGDSNDSNK
jgi:hypothetical protein